MIRALLVEDDPTARALLKAYLDGLEHVQVCGTAEDGLEALEKIHSQAPDLLMLDLVMPTLNGLGVLRELDLQPQKSRPKIVVISRIDDQGIIDRAFALGASHYLVKPVNLREIPKLLSQLFCR